MEHLHWIIGVLAPAIELPQLASGLLRRFDVSAADDLQARTDAFSDLAIKFVEGLPGIQRIQRLAGQFQDASTSVGANYRAARRARSHADFTSKLGIVSEEADESVYWLARMKNNNIRSSTVDIELLLKEADELARIFGASHRAAKRRRCRPGAQ